MNIGEVRKWVRYCYMYSMFLLSKELEYVDPSDILPTSDHAYPKATKVKLKRRNISATAWLNAHINNW